MPTTETTPAPEQTAEEKFAAFWEERDAHAKRVAAKLKAAQDEINAGVDAGLYRDGLTGLLLQVQQNLIHLGGQLDPALVAPPAGLTPEFLATNQTAPRA